ncbi:RNA polymerase Rpb4-domain-containing protein [Lophiotrema nucula]|uniref:DNA-directed RNA polymerase III subunit RPC9 n=1 Tax=Lophiotrema nucula TaxID=690887 RepID=A0A6A5ZMM2_9PLEO|nr:RNA polymerase Rpb4-domain-containing protein [Lophiotrema nucula]
MKIKEAQSALLSNHELLLHLRAEKAEYPDKDDKDGKDSKDSRDGNHHARKPPPGLENIFKDALTYLESQESHLPTLIATHPERPTTLYKGQHSLFRALSQKYRLNKAEYLQLYNLRPSSQVQLELIIEEAGSRFTDEQLEDILNEVSRVFDEEEGNISEGAEHVELEKMDAKMKGATKKRGARRKV